MASIGIKTSDKSSENQIADPLVASLAENIEALNLANGPTNETAIFLQDICLKHRFIRSRDTSAIVEKPERLRAVNVGLAAAMARLESIATKVEQDDSAGDDLVAALGRMNLANPAVDLLSSPNIFVSVVKSSASVDILNNPAVKFIHGDVDGDVYLENLKAWARDSHEKISKGESEIPESLSQGDLYLCPTSIDAIEGAIGTVCEAVDAVIGTTTHQSCKRAFVSARPPGHHCGEDTPAGFCFVNNVAIAAAHAHLQHGIERVVILDVDLHHGNGTQSIAWQINEETYRKTLESECLESAGQPPQKPGLQVFYGSIHDVLSYPCEDGKADLVQAASVSLHGPHGQYIENIHLQPYPSDEHFFEVLYKRRYSQLLTRAEEFIANTEGSDTGVLVLISCGFDACEHEYPSMSRHGRKVPTTFYHRFTEDACAFADRFAQGRLVSVLEGGYSDRALTSGAMSHLCGLAHMGDDRVDEKWWSVENLEKLEKATKKRRGGRPSLPAAGSVEPWLDRAVAIFSALDAGSAQYMTSTSSKLAPSSMTLRERRKPSGLDRAVDTSPSRAPASKRDTPIVEANSRRFENSSVPASVSNQETSGINGPLGSGTEKQDSPPAPKKLPRVILHVRPPPGNR